MKAVGTSLEELHGRSLPSVEGESCGLGRAREGQTCRPELGQRGVHVLPRWFFADRHPHDGERIDADVSVAAVSRQGVETIVVSEGRFGGKVDERLHLPYELGTQAKLQ